MTIKVGDRLPDGKLSESAGWDDGANCPLRPTDVSVSEATQGKKIVVFGLPGDGINGVMEALRTRQDRIRFIQVRHEETAAFMACGYAKFTGRLADYLRDAAKAHPPGGDIKVDIADAGSGDVMATVVPSS